MKREIPTPVAVIALVLILGGVGFFYFYWSNRSNHGTGISTEDLRSEYLYRAKNGQMPGVTPEVMRKLQSRQ